MDLKGRPYKLRYGITYADLKNVWSCASVPLCTFMAWVGKLLPFYLPILCFPSTLIILNVLLDCYFRFIPCKVCALSIHCCSKAQHFFSRTTSIPAFSSNDYYSLFYVPVTVHREQSVKKEYQQDATI